MFSTVSTTVPVLWVGADDVSERNVTSLFSIEPNSSVLFWLTECEKMSVSFYILAHYTVK